MPLFHSNAIMAGYGLVLNTGATLALGERFSASGFLDDVRHFGATYLNYVGKPLAYILATPERPDDADNPLRVAFGNEANEKDIAAFSRAVRLPRVRRVRVDRERRDHLPGRGHAARARWAGRTTASRCCTRRPARSARPRCSVPDGEVTNLDEAVGEFVNTTGAGQFAGYYNDDAATAERMRGRDVLVRRPRLPRRRRLRLLRRPHRRLAARRRREPRRRAGRADPAAAPGRQPGRGVRRTRPARRATSWSPRWCCTTTPPSTPSLREVPCGAGGSRPEAVAAPRADRRPRSPRPPPTRCSSGSWSARASTSPTRCGPAPSAGRRTPVFDRVVTCIQQALRGTDR